MGNKEKDDAANRETLCHPQCAPTVFALIHNFP